MAASDDSEATTTVYTEPGLPDEREDYGPFRVAARNPDVPAFREWWRANPLNNLRAAGSKANLWRRFQAEVKEGKTPVEAARGPHTMTLEDLKRPPMPPGLDKVYEDAHPDAAEPPSDELWWGTPDPEIYAPGTTHLDKQQLAEELGKGNVVTLRKMREQLAGAQDWEIDAIRKLLMLHQLKSEMVMPMPDGTTVSFWDLYKYVRCNPQLKALAERGVNAVDAADGMTREERLRLLEDVAPWTLDPEAESLTLPPRAAKKLPMGLLASATHYSRRPTRWLKGLDGREDLTYGLYVNEAQAGEVLGPKWARRGAEQVLSSSEYFDDLIAAGPLLGMTLVAVTSRPLPLEEATSAWGDRLAQQIDRLASSQGAGPSGAGAAPDAAVKPCCKGKAAALAAANGDGGSSLIPRPVFGPVEDSREALRELGALFERGRLEGQTRLLEADGSGRLRKGATLLLSAAPGGKVLVEAISPGKVREQEHYLLGGVADERLSAALFQMFLQPQQCLDQGFAIRAAYASLWYVNGLKSYNADDNPAVRPLGAPPRPPVKLPRRGRGAKWALPAPGRDPSEAAPGLVGDVKRRVAYQQVHDAFARAAAAGDAVQREEGMDADAWLQAKRAAAAAALGEALGGMGLNVQGLTLALPQARADLAAAASPLQVP